MSDDTIGSEDAMALLQEHGWIAEEDGDGDIVFRNQGFSHVLLPYPHDSEYMSILIPNLFEVRSVFDRDVALDEISRVNREYKLGKACLGGSPEQVHVSYEFLVSDRDSLDRSIRRGCDMLPMMAGDIRNAIKRRIAAVASEESA